MKTQTNKNDLYSTVRLPEIITWVIGLIVFTSLLLSLDLMGQTLDEYKQDTIWLRSGEVIPCKIVSLGENAKTISITYRDDDGKLILDQIPKTGIQRFKGSDGRGQDYSDLYKLEFKDGTVLTGSILSETDSVMEFFIDDIGTLTISKDHVKSVIPLEVTGRRGKAYWYKNPHATRLLFAPTAIPLKRGEGYYQNIYVLVNMFNYGVLNNLSIGGGFDIITMFARIDGEWNPMLNFNVKTAFKVADKFHAGAGGMYVTLPGEFSSGILYGVGTYGSYNSNLTFGLGWGFVDGTFEKKPFIMFGGMARLAERLWLVSENWIAPVDGGTYYNIFSYGIRIASPRVAVDIAFLNNKDIFENALVLGIPYVDVVIKFGKQK